ncbi:VF530 family DNA-binding protein [Allohahella marinimesophila]|uniref:DNA-binding protein VF530 n=1 Tax=Allohahella marinimesophila TaxID=1054972 RepID=A0ABP7PH89_9GAMM
MTDDINYQNNPLHGVSLKTLVTELVDHYGYEILFAYLDINSFKNKPSIDSSVKFLKKTEWAREKVEAFYLYQFKNLPRASAEQFELPPRDRIVPENQKPGEPAQLSLEDAERLREKRAKKAAERREGSAGGARSGSGPRQSYPARKSGKDSVSRPKALTSDGVDPWAHWRGKSS